MAGVFLLQKGGGRLSDGSLIFDTKIDKEGFNNGINDIKKNLEKAQNQMIKEFEKTQNAMKKTEAEIDKVSASLNTMYQEAKSKYDGLPNNQRLIDAELEKNAEFQKSIQKVEELNSQYTAQEKQCKILKDNINELTEKKKQLNDVEDEAKHKMSNNKPIKDQVKEANTLEKAIKKLASRFKLLITAMIIRGAINAAKDGFNDLARYSKNFNVTMSQLQGTFLQARNSITTAFAPVLQALTPIITTVTNGIINLMNAIAQVNAVVFKNSTTFTKAKKVTTDYAKSLGNVSKEADKSFANFDEINQLTQKSGGDSGTPSAGEMFEEDTVDEGIVNIFDRVKEKMQEMQNDLELQRPLKNWLLDVDKSLKTLKNTVVGGLKEDFAVIGDTIQKLIEPIILTIADDILPIVTQVFDEVVKTVTVAFGVLNGVFQTIWEGGIKPALMLLVDIWIGVWDTIHNAWDTWGGPIFENIRTTISNLGETFQNVWDKLIGPVWQEFMDMVDSLWNEHLQPLLDNFLNFVGTVINEGLNILNDFLLPIFNFLVENLSPFIKLFIDNVINSVQIVAGTIVDVINGVITRLTGIVTFISGVFTGDFQKAWDGIKLYFEGFWDGMVSIVKGAINLMINFANGLISAVRTALNYLIDAINKLSFDAPDWVEEKFGIESFGFNIKRIPEIKIPALATGTVVPANYGNFLAMLGDNKHETEVVSPLSTMKQALIEALQEYGGQNITIKFEESSIGDLVRLLKPYIDKENRRVGSSTRVGGAY